MRTRQSKTRSSERGRCLAALCTPRVALLGPMALVAALLMTLAGCRPPPQGPVPLELSVSTTPPGAEVAAGAVVLGKTPLKANIPVGSRVLSVRLAGFEMAWAAIPAEAAGSYAVDVALQREFAAVLFESTPPGAALRLKGEDKGKTPVLIPRLELGTYEAELASQSYAPRKFRVVLDSPRPRRVQQTLDSVIGSVEVWTNPGGVDVYLGEKLVGTTPERGDAALVLKAVPAGDYSISGRKPGYKALTQNVAVHPQKREVVKLAALQALPGTLTITSTPVGAEVVNSQGNLLGATPLTLNDLPLGLIAVKVRKAGYAEEIKSIEVVPGATQSLDATLRKVTGGLELVSEPSGVSVLLDGKGVGKTPASDNPKVSALFSVEELAPGGHFVELQHPEYEPASLRFQVEQGQTASLGVFKLKKRWVPTHRLKLLNGNTYEGVLVSQGRDGSVLFETAPKSKVGYGKAEIETLEALVKPPGK